MNLEFNYQTQDDIVFFKLIGKIMGKEDAINLLEEVDKNTLNNKANFILNLAKITHINSSGLNALINILTKSRNAGGDTVICNVNEKISKLFLITKLNTLFTISEDESSARKLFSEKLNI